MPVVMKRPGGLVENETMHPWAIRFGSLDSIPSCDCCGSGLPRYAVIVADRVYGRDCAVKAGIIPQFRKDASTEPTKLDARSVALIAQHSDVYRFCVESVMSGQTDLRVIRASYPDQAMASTFRHWGRFTQIAVAVTEGSVVF